MSDPHALWQQLQDAGVAYHDITSLLLTTKVKAMVSHKARVSPAAAGCRYAA